MLETSATRRSTRRATPDAVPWLLARLAQRPDHWFHALNQITDAQPVQPEHQGNRRRDGPGLDHLGQAEPATGTTRALTKPSRAFKIATSPIIARRSRPPRRRPQRQNNPSCRARDGNPGSSAIADPSSNTTSDVDAWDDVFLWTTAVDSITVQDADRRSATPSQPRRGSPSDLSRGDNLEAPS